MATLGDLVRTILPLARPVGTAVLEASRAERDVTWVALTGWDLADSDLRFALSLAARVIRRSS